MSSRRVIRRRRRAVRARGFTLTELLAAVAIMSILATLSIYAWRTNLSRSDTATAIVVVKSIAAAEEQYRALNQVYLDVTGDGGPWYPSPGPVPKNTRIPFWSDLSTPSDLTKRWQQLGPDIRVGVDFVFKANAGLPGATLPEVDTGGGESITLPESVSEPWYMVQAMADPNGDSVRCIVVASSWSSNVVTANEGE